MVLTTSLPCPSPAAYLYPEVRPTPPSPPCTAAAWCPQPQQGDPHLPQPRVRGVPEPPVVCATRFHTWSGAGGCLRSWGQQGWTEPMSRRLVGCPPPSRHPCQQLRLLQRRVSPIALCLCPGRSVFPSVHPAAELWTVPVGVIGEVGMCPALHAQSPSGQLLAASGRGAAGTCGLAVRGREG